MMNTPLLATDPWPAESNTNALILTNIDPVLNDNNMSGAFWNPSTRTLWIANNYGRFYAIVEDGAGSFQIATNVSGTKAQWLPGGDVEAICQADLMEDVVYVLDENGWIREYDVSDYGVIQENRNWDIRAYCPEVSGAGPEGITFVPDDWLIRERFRNSNGQLYHSTNGMNGLMFIGIQSGGYIHVFDLHPSNTTFEHIGRYETERSETAGLEFERETGKLYVWHNTGANYLEIVELNSYTNGSERKLKTLLEYTGPRSGNLEGFAIDLETETNAWCFITDDDNLNSEAIVWYPHFQRNNDVDVDQLPDSWELYNFGTITQTTAGVDSDGDHLTNGEEYTAGTEPTNAASLFIWSETNMATNNQHMMLKWLSVSNRIYEIRHGDSCVNGFTQIVQSSIAATPPVNSWTSTISGDTSFYQVTVSKP